MSIYAIKMVRVKRELDTGYLMQGVVISQHECARRGLDASDSVRFQPATPDEVKAAKNLVGITPAVEAEYNAEIEAIRVRHNSEISGLNVLPSNFALSLLNALHDWREIEKIYLQDNTHDTKGSYQGQLSLGFENDRLRAKLSVIAEHIKRCLDSLIPSIVRLPGIDATPLQQFVRTIDSYKTEPNKEYQSAEMLAEVLPHKLEDIDRPINVNIARQDKPIEATLHQPKKPLWRRVSKMTWAIILGILTLIGVFSSRLKDSQNIWKFIQNPHGYFHEPATR